MDVVFWVVTSFALVRCHVLGSLCNFSAVSYWTVGRSGVECWYQLQDKLCNEIYRFDWFASGKQSFYCFRAEVHNSWSFWRFRQQANVQVLKRVHKFF